MTLVGTDCVSAPPRMRFVHNMMRLANQTAIVTGGGQGIGKSIVLGLAREGANILVCGRHEETLKQTAEEIQQLGRQALTIVTDVSREEEVDEMAQSALREFGGVNILVRLLEVFLQCKFLKRSYGSAHAPYGRIILPVIKTLKIVRLERPQMNKFAN